MSIASECWKIYKKYIAPLVAMKIIRQNDFTPEIIIKMDGGLASQMWQYAIGRRASILSGLPVSYDTLWFENNGMDINKKYTRNFQLDVVFPQLRFFKRADKKKIEMYQLYFNLYPKIWKKYNAEIMVSKKPRYMGDIT